MSDKVIEANEDNFEKVVENEKGFVLVDFWAPWCGPCRMMSPIIDEIAEENNQVKFAKINVDKNQEIATRFRVMNIPFFALFKDGKVIASRAGGTSKENFEEWIKDNAK